jgi:large subunit ribosomal protein L24
MSAMKIKKGDTVVVIAGKDKGKDGKVAAVNTKDNTVIVENVNMVSKHNKNNGGQNVGITTKEAPLHISNVMLLVDGKPARVGFDIKDGKKVRVAKFGKGETKVIDTVSSSKPRKASN